MAKSRQTSLSTVWEPEKKVYEAWWDFEEALAHAIRNLPIGATLELTLDPVASATEDARYSVVLSIGESRRLKARAVSNASLPEGYRLNRSAIAALVAFGWSPPGVEPDSGNDFGMSTDPDQATEMAAIVVRTLSDVYGAPHPAFLIYVGRAPDGTEIELPALGTARASNRETWSGRTGDLMSDPISLRNQVRAVVAAMLSTSPDQLAVDEAGDLKIRAGTAMVFVRVRDNPPLVDVFSPVLTGAAPTEQLYAKLSEFTNRMPIGRLYYAQETVWASVPVFGRNFQPSHLVLAVQVMTGLADELGNRLKTTFGGLRFHESRTFSVNAYLDTENYAGAQRVVAAVDKIALLLGYDEPTEEVWSAGSFWRRARAGLKKGMTSDEIRARLVKIERALELAHLDSRQAEVDRAAAAAVTELINSLNDISQACLLVGSILIVKYHDGNASVLYSRNLTQPEIRS